MTNMILYLELNHPTRHHNGSKHRKPNQCTCHLHSTTYDTDYHHKMMKRTSDYFRGRESVAIVNETRSVPYKIISLLLCCLWTAVGIRNIFFCGSGLGSDDQSARAQMFPDCSTNRWQSLASGIMGLWALFNAIIRFNMCVATHIADLYNMMFLLVCIDCGIFFVVIKNVNYMEIPMFWRVLLPCCLGYEGYVFSVAKAAHQARLKMTKIYTKM